jgi:hypothetical protein
MPRLSSRRVVHAAIVVSWAAMMTLLLYRHYGPPPKAIIASSASLPRGIFGERWMGIYFNHKKIGYASREFSKSIGGYSISQRMKMRLGIMGSQKDIELETSARLGRDLALNSFFLSLKADSNMTATGTVEGRNLHVSIETAGTRTEADVPLKERPVLDLAIVPGMLRDGLAVGKRYTMSVLDPSTLGREEMSLEVVGREKITVMDKDIDAIKIKGSAGSGTLSLWITGTGEVLKEESPMGFVLVAEEREEAMKVPSSAPDITGRIAVPFNMKLPDTVRYLRVKLSGIDLRDFDINGSGQSLKGDILEVRQEDLKENTGVLTGGAGPESQYLADTISIQSKDLAIMAAAKAVVKNEKDRIGAGRLICSWVYRNVRKEPSMTVPVATRILKTMRGDCNEHATLYVALARAAGIPSRIALGLVYRNGFFYYHAWPEIYAKGWVAVDPTLGQFPADAAHIRLITGDFEKQARIAAAIGKIRVEGLEYR